MSRKTWFDYTVALSIRLLLYLNHHKYVYMTNHGLPTLGVVVLQDDLCCVQSPCLPVLVYSRTHLSVSSTDDHLQHETI